MVSRVELDRSYGELLTTSSLIARFGEELISGKIDHPDKLLPIFLPHNRINVGLFGNSSGIQLRWFYDPRYMGSERNFNLALTHDNIMQEVLNRDNLPFNLEDLNREIEQVDRSKKLSNRTPLLKSLKEHGLDFVAGIDPDYFGEYTEKRLVFPVGNGIGVRLDCNNTGLSIKVNLPLDTYYDKNHKILVDVLKIISKWAGLENKPQQLLNYKFMFPETAAIEKPHIISSDFKSYFHRVIEVWENFPKPLEIRALLGWSKDGKIPVLIPEDLFINLANTSKDYSGSIGISELLTVSHSVIFESFKRQSERRLINPNLFNLIPEGNWEDQRDNWLHMFVQWGENGVEPVLKEDVQSNTGKDKLRDSVLEPMRRMYGIGYGGQIELRGVEVRARTPMYIPMISRNAKKLYQMYGDKAARGYQRAAVSYLINGQKASFEKYEAYCKLLGIEVNFA